MSIFTSIVCDRCGENLTNESGMTDIENEARGKGWMLGTSGDLCARCAKKSSTVPRHRIFRRIEIEAPEKYAGR